MEEIGRESVVALRVSQADFPDEPAVAALAARIGDSVQIIVAPELFTGECLFDLQLGHIEISPLVQWRALETVLIESAKLEIAQ